MTVDNPASTAPDDEPTKATDVPPAEYPEQAEPQESDAERVAEIAQGDPVVPDLGNAEPPADVDPAPQLNDDANDDLATLEEGEDDGTDDDLSDEEPADGSA